MCCVQYISRVYVFVCACLTPQPHLLVLAPHCPTASASLIRAAQHSTSYECCAVQNVAYRSSRELLIANSNSYRPLAQPPLQYCTLISPVDEKVLLFSLLLRSSLLSTPIAQQPSRQSRALRSSFVSSRLATSCPQRPSRRRSLVSSPLHRSSGISISRRLPTHHTQLPPRSQAAAQNSTSVVSTVQ